ncbi:MAG: SMC-Scp complex subunit ScpB [Deltaproteobacteria bacterium]|nr:SMC-Scp complex subunit ScpB [Deltaproteobacteria bacterium]
MSGDNEIKDAVNPGTETTDADPQASESTSSEKRLSAREIFKAGRTEEDNPPIEDDPDDEENHPDDDSDNGTNEIHEIEAGTPVEESDAQSDVGENNKQPGNQNETVDSSADTDAESDPSHETDDRESETASTSDTIDTDAEMTDVDDESDDTSDSESTDDDNILFLDESEDDTPEEILLSRLESLIFIYPEPITVRRLAKHLSLSGKRVRELIAVLQEHYANRGINLSEISGGFQFHTNAQNAEVIRTLTKAKPMKMSRPALETLAIVAYKQPCTRAEVEDVRRVDCGGTLKFLFEKELIRVLGRKEEPGRPIIYGTSSKFLEMFNLKSLTDLPSLHEYTELWDEHKELIDEDDAEDNGETLADTPEARQQTLPVDVPGTEFPEEPAEGAETNKPHGTDDISDDVVPDDFEPTKIDDGDIDTNDDTGETEVPDQTEISDDEFDDDEDYVDDEETSSNENEDSDETETDTDETEADPDGDEEE